MMHRNIVCVCRDVVFNEHVNPAVSVGDGEHVVISSPAVRERQSDDVVTPGGQQWSSPRQPQSSMHEQTAHQIVPRRSSRQVR